MIARLRTLWSRLIALVTGRRLDREFNEELATHLALLVNEGVRDGLSPDEARRAAIRRLGRPDVLLESHRAQRGIPLIGVLRQDLRYAIRTLARTPVFTLVVTVSLALGIGANTALFSLVDDLLLRSLPVPAPDRLVQVQQSAEFMGIRKPMPVYPPPLFDVVRANDQIVSEVVGFSRLDRPLIAIGGVIEPTREVDRVSSNFFRDLGVAFAAGRPPDQADGPVAVLGHRLWRDRFHGAADAIGQMIVVDNAPVPIVGVAAAGFSGLMLDSATDLWLSTPTPGALQMIARLAPGVTAARARAALQSVLPQPEGVPVPMDVELRPAGMGLSVLREQYERPLWALSVLVTVLLLITCTNIGSLLMVRSAGRRRELMVRVALGALRSRLLTYSLVESAVLGAIGGAGALVVAAGGVSLLLSMLPLPVAPQQLAFHVDMRVLAFTAGTALASALLFGLLPAWRMTKIEIDGALRSGRGETAPVRVRRLGRVLVASQVALSVILLVGAGLFLQTLRNLSTLDLGFDPDRLVQVLIDTRAAGYGRGKVSEVSRLLLERVGAVPGVESVTAVRNPLLRGAMSRGLVRLPGLDVGPDEAWDAADVGPEFFETMGIRIVNGRAFIASDFTHRAPALVVNEAWVRRYFPHDDPVARQIGIVGVVDNVRLAGVREEAGPTMFMPTQPEPDRINALEIRTIGDPRPVLPALRDTIRRINPRLLVGVSTMREEIDRGVARERIVAATSGFFGALGLVLVAVGIFGVASSTVAQRTNELGIRMALGATRQSVVGEALRETMWVSAAGLAVGLCAAFAAVQLAGSVIAGLLFGLTPTDALSLAGAAAVIVAVVAAACIGPARRATSIDPLTAIRHE